MATKIQLRHDTEAAWNLADPILAEGEMGIETDRQRSKLGDGATSWSALPYMADTNFDGNYVAKLGDNTAQVITGTGGLKTDGLLVSAGGVKVTGGSQSSVNTGVYYSTGLNGLVLTSTIEQGDGVDDLVGIQSYIANRKTSDINSISNFQATNFTNPEGSTVLEWRMFDAHKSFAK